MSTNKVEIPLAEAFLSPFIVYWNQLRLEELRRIEKRTIDDGSNVHLSFVGQVDSPFGYEALCFTFEKTGVFELDVYVEGTPGHLSFQAYHPVAVIRGNVAVGEAWLRAHTAKGSIRPN